jgi:hypothetical protein
MSVKLKNIVISLVLSACLFCVLLILSTKTDHSPGIISVGYFWLNIANLVSIFGALLLLVLRIFKVIDKNRNFLYAFFGATNMILGICALSFFFLNMLNIVGLHNLLANLLLGVIIIVDLFLFDYMFKSKTN